MEHVESEQAPPLPAPPANPIQPITVNATQKEVKMNKPTPFTGDRRKLEEFLIKTDMYLVMEQPLVLSHLILSTMPLSSYQMNYPTLI